MKIINRMFGNSKKLDRTEAAVNDLKEFCVCEIPAINEKIEDLRKTLCEIALQIGRITSRLSASDYEALISIASDAIRVKREQQISESAKHIEDWRKTVRTFSELEKDELMLRLLSMVEGDTGSEWKDDVAKIRNDLRKKYGLPTEPVGLCAPSVDDDKQPTVDEKGKKPVKRAKRQPKKAGKKFSKKEKTESKRGQVPPQETAFVSVGPTDAGVV